MFCNTYTQRQKILRHFYGKYFVNDDPPYREAHPHIAHTEHLHILITDQLSWTEAPP